MLSRDTGCAMSRCMVPATPRKRHPADSPLIGLVSDSHGQATSLANALAFLTQKGCNTLYHLGDICDSLHPETADACVGLLREFQVNCVKGNNDHAIVVNHDGRESASIKAGTVDFLRRLPLLIQMEGSLLAHSLPFEKELGLACMVGVMTDDYARTFFRRFAGHVLFRGHSHSPEITYQDRLDRVKSERIPPGRAIEISEHTPCIVTCGALDQGLCLLWSPADDRVTSLQL